MSQTIAQTPQPDPVRVLLLDDDRDFAEMAEKLLEREGSGFEVIIQVDPEQAISTLESTTIDAVISDYRMPKRDGLEVLEEVRSIDPTLPFFLLTGAGSESIASEAITAGVTDYLQKGEDANDFSVLANRIRNAVSKRRNELALKRNERFLQGVFDGLKNGLAVANENYDIIRANEWLEDRADKTLTGQKCYKEIRGVDSPEAGEMCPVKEALKTGDRQRMEIELTHFKPSFWAEISTDPLPRTGDDTGQVLIQVQDISERKQRERKLEKRERLFRALHEQTNRCLEASNRAEIFEHISTGVSETLAHERVAVLEYETDQGSLIVANRTDPFQTGLGSLERVRPGTGPLWEAFQDGGTMVVPARELHSSFERAPGRDTDFLAVPIGDYGLILVHRQSAVKHPDIDIELLDLCAANAEAILERIQSAGKLGSVTDQVTAQAWRIENLRDFLHAIRRIHSAIAAAETRKAVETALVQELVETDFVEFAWLGRPQAGGVSLTPSTWAGHEMAYLDSLDLDSETALTPAQEAAKSRETVVYHNIAEQLQNADWAKAALSIGFESVSAFPILYDGVLYGVLTVYGNESGQIDQAAESILADVAALVAAHIGVQNVWIGTTEPPTVELELTISDTKHIFNALSTATGVQIRFETILESLEDTVRIVVSVPEESTDRVLEAARSLTKVREASWFGNPAERRVLLEVDRPFIGTGVTRHGGMLRAANADGNNSTVTIGIPADISVRPLMEWLQTTYGDIDLIAKRDPEPVDNSGLPNPKAMLTDRQAEVLKAAYVGGYFENPREITGEELAESFDISGSAVYKHLRSAEKRLLDSLFDISVDN